MLFLVFFFQAEDGIRDLVRSRGLGDVYKRQFQELMLGQVNLAHAATADLLRETILAELACLEGLSLIHI